ncbi:hypothetical protein JCM21900_004150 [Sporobolomyces salmonicolor]
MYNPHLQLPLPTPPPGFLPPVSDAQTHSAHYFGTSPHLQIVPLSAETLPVPLPPPAGLSSGVKDENNSTHSSTPAPDVSGTGSSCSPNPPPKASTSRTPYVPPPPPPPLGDPVALLVRSREGLAQLIGQGNIDARPSRQALQTTQKSGACSSCRAAKAKCSQDEPACTRCVTQQLECTYPVFAKRGRKRTMTPNQALLENVHRDIERALALLRHSVLSPPSSTETTTSSLPTLAPPLSAPPTHSYGAPTIEGGDDEDVGSRELKSVIESPLAVLAHISSLKVSESTEEESGKSFLPKKDEAGPAEGYFATGLYQLRSDADPAYDPVNLGIISEEMLTRLVNLYFADLHQFVFHLSPSLHTPQFLRDTSPFLTTALAYICATFDAAAQPAVPSLFHHLQLINTRIWAEGLKSLEIVQAYLLLIHWTPIANNWGDDRRWGWLGQAIRIATEIKLHKTLNQATYDFYRSVTPLGEDAFQQLSDDRARSWKLLFVAETAFCVSTGRLGSVSNLLASWPGPPGPTNLAPGHPLYNLHALLDLNKIYAKAIRVSNSVQDAEAASNPDLRASFKAQWLHEQHDWELAWPHINAYVRLVATHNRTILLSMSLRFKGPVAPVLEECKVSALRTAHLAVDWPDQSFKWFSNLGVVIIAYAATLLLRIGTTKPGPLDHVIKTLCSAISDKLLQIGEMRPNTRTLSTLHGTRIRTLLSASSFLPATCPPLSPAAVPPPCLELAYPSSTSQHLYPPTFPTQAQLASIALARGIGRAEYPYPPAAGSSASTSAQHEPPSLFDLGQPSPEAQARGQPADSGMLWDFDLFHDHAPPTATASAAASPQPVAAAAAVPPPPGSPLVAPAERTWRGTTGDALDWVHRNALETDWFHAEPGAWAW